LVNLWAVGTVGAHPLDVVKALAADQLGLRQRDDQPKRRASAPTTAKPAYGVNDSSSARSRSVRAA